MISSTPLTSTNFRCTLETPSGSVPAYTGRQMLRLGRICTRSNSGPAVFAFLAGPRPLVVHDSTNCLDYKRHETKRSGDNSVGLLNQKLRAGSCGACLCTIAETVLVQARDPSQLALEIENAVDQQRFDDAWRAYEKHVHMDGLPRKSVLSKLITGFVATRDAHRLNQSYSVVDRAFQEKCELLEKEPLIYLSLVLAQCALPNLAINVVRKLVKMEAYPPVAAWSAIIAHMCQTATGAFLAADMVMEIGYLFQHNRVDPRKKSNRPLLSMKPNSFTFNTVLTASLLFGTTKKAEQLLELLPRIGVKPEVSLLIVMARIYERNGHKDEIQKLKRHVDEACGLSESEFRQFYDCLLSCHLNFGDLDSAVDMVLDMLKKGNHVKRSLEAAKAVLEAVESSKIYLPYEKTGAENSGSPNKPVSTDSEMLCYVSFFKDKSFAKLEQEARGLFKLLSDKLQEQVGLVKSEHGILHPTETLYAKLVKAFLEADKISALASFLVKASKEDTPVSVESSFVVQVINACISVGLLEQAHDLLDEMRFSGIRVGSSIYSSLLKAYCKEGHHEDDITTLLKDAQQSGIQLDSSCYEDLIQLRVHRNNTTGALHLFKEMKNSNVKSGPREFEMLVQGCDNNEAALTTKLVEEVRTGHTVNHAIHDWNNVIHFFCKKRLMHDAHKALSKMRVLGHMPNAQTFHSLVTSYAAIGGKYVEVTDLWGEMKVLAINSIKFDQELLDSLLYCFVRGGFFLRAMEVIEMMEKCKMFVDKYKSKSLWLKYHRTLSKGKAPKVQTEAQLVRREAALHFKRWIGLT